ncbi:transcriptional repressor LexA [Roseospira visakhapatnamensis]|uniref:LexA repressor n=1 Tax=Roseospira visakhapatnamensis TaxID=390880 RepID=A0A7W6RCM8_9PROT|nr:transcriptional repressor LexA [Roseospira visakhapatnamensis]MBB4266079.1 repressor LexA [Roseospira visakhapatnamensis]
MLTRKQHELLFFIDRHLRETGVSPSFDEMKDALGLKSKSGIHRLISGLEERGFIRRLAHRARALEVLRLPGDQTPQGALAGPEAAAGRAEPAGFDPKVIRGDFGGDARGETRGGLSGATVAGAVGAVELPLLGKIAAGTPIAALSDTSSSVEVPAGLLGMGDHYALTVEGDSMIDAGILDGDTVLIRRCDGADSGTIVVALVDDEEATLKRLRRKGNSIALEPANTTYQTQVLPPDRVKVQGRLVGLLRRY